jgi:hypothetical protein
MFRRFVSAAFVALPLVIGTSASTLADGAKGEAVRVRGTILDFSGKALKVKTREGQTIDLALAGDWMVSSVAKAALTHIKPGDYVGIASLAKKDGGDGALEVLIFPPNLKGAGEGSFGWDLQPNSTMTNGSVADAVKAVDGRTVTVSYHGKEKKIAVPEGTPVVTFAPATQADLKREAVVFVIAQKDASGAIAAQRVVVGTNGVVPPM